jgi:hypothetical protein
MRGSSFGYDLEQSSFGVRTHDIPALDAGPRAVIHREATQHQPGGVRGAGRQETGNAGGWGVLQGIPSNGVRPSVEHEKPAYESQGSDDAEDKGHCIMGHKDLLPIYAM